MNNYELQINKVAQGIIPWNEAELWFVGLPPENKKDAFLALRICCRQAHPKENEIPEAIKLAGLKPTFTPCVLAKTKKFPESALTAICALPGNEQIKSFKLLLAIFAIADQRRRNTECQFGCTHEWHNLK